MSEKLTQEQLDKKKEKTIKLVDDFLTRLNEENEDSKKRSNLLMYWINNYIYMIRKEKNFSPKNYIKYNKGDIISVDFGFRIGSEFGGLHFAVVMDKYNSINSSILTVVPLKSLKGNFNENQFEIKLEKGLYDLHKEKFDNMVYKLQDDLLKLSENVNAQKFKKEIERINKKLNNAEELKKELEHLKQGTVANIAQITTVSKIRIKKPKYNKDTLYNIKLCQNDIIKIDNALSKLYIGKK